MNPKHLSVQPHHRTHRSLPLSALVLAVIAATTVPAATIVGKATPSAIAAQPVRPANRPKAPGNRGEADQLWRNGVKHYQAKQFREAIAPLTQLTTLEPDNYKALILLGGAYSALTEYGNAATQFELATKVDPKASSAWSLLGNTRNQLKDYQAALPAFAKALELEAKNADALLGNGVAHYNLQQYDEAIIAYKAYTEVLPGKAMGHAYLGDAYRRKGDRAAAITAYEKALSLDANQSIAKTGLERVKAMKP